MCTADTYILSAPPIELPYNAESKSTSTDAPCAVLDTLYSLYLPSEQKAQATEPLTALNHPAAHGMHENVKIPFRFGS